MFCYIIVLLIKIFNGEIYPYSKEKINLHLLLYYVFSEGVNDRLTCIYKSSFTDIISDENSFYRCLSYFLNEDQKKHDQIRMEIIKFMSGDELLPKTDKFKRYGKLMDENDDYYSYLT